MSKKFPELNVEQYLLLKEIHKATGDAGYAFTFADEIDWSSCGIPNAQSYGGFLQSLIRAGLVHGDDIQPNDQGEWFFQMGITPLAEQLLADRGDLEFEL
jgi:hypothetical protein